MQDSDSFCFLEDLFFQFGNFVAILGLASRTWTMTRKNFNVFRRHRRSTLKRWRRPSEHFTNWDVTFSLRTPKAPNFGKDQNFRPYFICQVCAWRRVLCATLVCEVEVVNCWRRRRAGVVIFLRCYERLQCHVQGNMSMRSVWEAMLREAKSILEN